MPKQLHIALQAWTKLSLLGFGGIVVGLGLLQPTYNHLQDTVSALAFGAGGYWLSVSFGLLSSGFLALAIKVHLLKTQPTTNLAKIFEILAVICLLLIAFPANPHDAQVRHFTGFSSVQSFGHFALVSLLLGGLIPIMSVEMTRNFRTQTHWQPIIKTLNLLTWVGIMAAPSWLVLRSNGWLYGYKGLLEKIGITGLLWLLWQITTAINKTFTVEPASQTPKTPATTSGV